MQNRKAASSWKNSEWITSLKLFIHFLCTGLIDFPKNKNGNVAIIFAITIIPVIGLVGASIDYANALRLKQQIAGSIDAAALAAGSSLDLSKDQREALAKAFIEANFKKDSGVTIGTPEIIVGENTVKITLTGTVDTSLLGILGIDKLPVTVSNEVKLKDTKLELALVLDTTLSMNGSKISTLRSSVKTLINTLYVKDNAATMIKVGIVPFANTVNIGTQYKNENWLQADNSKQCSYSHSQKKNICTTQPWNGCVVPRSSPNNVNDAAASGSKKIPAKNGNCSIKSLMTLSNNETSLKAKANSLSASGYTHIPSGLAWGWRILSPNSPFTDAASYEDEKWTKAIVLMTDGANTKSYSNTGGSADTNTTKLCTNIKAMGITVYTVAFQINSFSTKRMIQNCATKASYYYNANSNSALNAAFNSIAEQLSQLRISK